MFGFLSGLLPCLRPTQQSKILEDELSQKSPLIRDKCIFCHATPQNGFNVVWEDEAFIAFKDHKPASMHHFLVITKAHVESVRTLQKSDVPLITSMKTIGDKLLDDLDVPSSMRRMGFHIPPFNSVYHLHLHVQGLPYTGFDRGVKYPIARGRGSHQKGFSWFAEVDQSIRILEQGKHIGVFPC
ncbi:HIT-like protein [Crucibulum laeve]|uniref:HIT-like protein n=1 Tax=Crucibulum laeve TaxID=68775 RepID=A0A5C3LQM2_9AGAR|nr:HIT-like protein [Crucibulum laeve]